VSVGVFGSGDGGRVADRGAGAAAEEEERIAGCVGSGGSL
jgi:hypothetical protein